MYYYTQLSPSSLPSEKNWLLTVLAYSYSAAAAVWKRKRKTKKRDSSSVSGTSFSLPFFFFLEIKSASLRGNSGGGSEKEEEDSRPKVFFLLSLSRRDRPAVSAKGDRAFKSVGSKKVFHSRILLFLSLVWAQVSPCATLHVMGDHQCTEEEEGKEA